MSLETTDTVPAPKMTASDVQTRLDFIAAYADDPERAHGLEDDLWQDVLNAIADGSPNGAELARAALRSTAIEFSRWKS